LLGPVSNSFFFTHLATEIQALTSSGVISPAKIAFSLMNNVMLSSVDPPTTPGASTCCHPGYHSATGSPPQFYAVMDYDTTATFKSRDISVAAHEIGELMNDPLGSNATPPWGGAGGISEVYRVTHEARRYKNDRAEVSHQPTSAHVASPPDAAIAFLRNLAGDHSRLIFPDSPPSLCPDPRCPLWCLTPTDHSDTIPGTLTI